ncbi:MAG: hypothetical protein QOG06_1705 [Gaiellaceae bacterium]|nr:hypothetical protein [Gaiellaceae bacterium]
MSREKELDFFVASKNWERGLDWYEAQFPVAKVRGETSPAYSAYPFYRDVPERIRQVLPAARIVYLVRDPIERIVSHYEYRAATYRDMGALDDVLAEPQLGRWFVEVSRYALQLERYLQHFGGEEVLVVDSEQLRASPGATLSGIFRFLEVDPDFRSVEFERSHNQGSARPRPNRAGRIARAALRGVLTQGGYAAVASRVPDSLKGGFRTTARATLSGDSRKWLEDELHDDIARLRELTGLPLAGWSL